MNFTHDGDRQMLADTFGRFIADRYGFAVRQRAAESALGYDEQVWRELTELGLVGALVDADAGGFGGTGFDLMVVFEQVGRGLLVEPFLPALMAARALGAAGGRQELIGEIVAGRRVAFAHQEPDTPHDVDHVAAAALRADGGFTLSGAKAVVAGAESAELLLVSANIDDNIALFVVPREENGVIVRGYANIDGGRSAELTLQDVRLPADALIAQGVGAVAAIADAQDAGLLALCAEAVGAMDRARDMTVEYLRTRVQFGVPIGTFQALQHRMATLLIEIEQARSSVINAAASFDDGRTTHRRRMLAAAKYTIGRIGTLVAEETIQLHGGIGMTWELPLPHYAKRLIMIGHMLGDEDHHLQQFIALSQA